MTYFVGATNCIPCTYTSPDTTARRGAVQTWMSFFIRPEDPPMTHGPRRTQRRLTLRLVAVCFIALLSVSALDGCSRGPVRTGNVFVIAIESEADVLDPQV